MRPIIGPEMRFWLRSALRPPPCSVSRRIRDSMAMVAAGTGIHGREKQSGYNEPTFTRSLELNLPAQG
jgi:hypothetical protein